MNCEEFLRLLQETLDGKVSERIIADNVDYYKSYIRDQMTSGRSESEVLQMLGDPRLLANDRGEHQICIGKNSGTK